MPLDPALVGRFAALVGRGRALTAADAQAPYLEEQRGRWTGTTPLVLQPGTVDEVAAIVRLAAETRVGIVPQGGNTGLVGGQIPDLSGEQIVVSLRRLSRVRQIDAPGHTLIAEAGATLAAVQQGATEANLLFPLSLASEGSATIGGNLSTNAGGTAVLAYGNMRALVLGVEVVLASGEVWNGLTTLRKDNTGYNLKDLFIGAEGTLGIVTAAALKLFPRPRSRATVFAATPSPAAALDALGLIRAAAPGTVTTFELMSRAGLDFVLKHIPGTREPLADRSPWYLLIEIVTQADADLTGATEAALAAALEHGALSDAAIAQSEAQAGDFWKLRESMSDAQKHEGGSIKHDVAVPIAAVPAFIDEALTAVRRLAPDSRPVPFGHMGDGNIHFNISQPEGVSTTDFLKLRDAMGEAVHAVVARHKGSISAEHGIGVDKRALLPRVKPAVEMAMMRAIKQAFDPLGIMNPGKLL